MRSDLLVETATQIGNLVLEKNKAYGNSFEESGKILQILFPHGIEPSQYQDLLTVVRIIDKLFRIATNKKAFSEDPWRDIAGYSLLSLCSDKGENNDGA